jgi:methylase of polypeptide subunit release factors
MIAYILGARLPARARVLDLGCGTGADAIFLAEQNYEAHGLDFSAQALLLAEQRRLIPLSQVRLYVVDAPV